MSIKPCNPLKKVLMFDTETNQMHMFPYAYAYKLDDRFQFADDYCKEQLSYWSDQLYNVELVNTYGTFIEAGGDDEESH